MRVVGNNGGPPRYRYVVWKTPRRTVRATLVLTIKTQGRRFSSSFQGHGDFYAPSSSARCPSGAWMRRACWRLAAVAANDPPASVIIWTMTSGTRPAGHVAGQVERQRATQRPTTSSQVERPCQGLKEHARLVAAAARAVASPASMPRRKGARNPPVPTPHEPMLAACEERQEPMQLAADMPERASPARPPEGRRIVKISACRRSPLFPSCRDSMHQRLLLRACSHYRHRLHSRQHRGRRRRGRRRRGQPKGYAVQRERLRERLVSS